MTGNKYGMMRVVRYSHQKNGQTMWDCVCDCGTKKTVNGYHLRAAATQSCGCSNPNRIDMSGKRYGRWIAISIAGASARGAMWNCTCDCGTTRKKLGSELRSGNSKSCGCGHIDSVTTHGMTASAEYEIWHSMKSRCFNPQATGFPSYGGRGITVCKRWKDSFSMFYRDMGPRPSASLTLERIDNDKNYTPKNCCWASRKRQQRNRRKSRMITHAGERLCLSEWAERIGMDYNTLFSRLSNGWSVERALSEPVH